jgi:hypothetical protein
MQYSWHLSGNVMATLTISRELDPDDVELLAEYFATTKKALLKHAQARANVGANSNPEAS